MNRKLKSIIAGSLVFTMCLGTAIGFGMKADVSNADDMSTQNKKVLSVVGDAKVTVAPDTATVSVGVETTAKTVTEAQQSNAKQMTAVTNAIKTLGIDAKNIQTGGYSIYPEYDYQYVTTKDTAQTQTTKQVFKDYKVSNTITVTIKDLSKTGKVIDVAVASGANVSNGVTFSLADQSVVYNQALAAAMKNAQAKAKTLGDCIGITLDKPARITENSYGGGMLQNYNTYNAKAMSADSAASTPVESGELIISASVGVEYNY